MIPRSPKTCRDCGAYYGTSGVRVDDGHDVVCDRCFYSPEIAPFTLYHGHPDQKFGHVFYSQNGEDLLALNLFHQLGIMRPTYLDVGAHHPTVASNTRLLYDRGSRGINVEANPTLIEAFKRERPGDINLSIGIAAERSRRTFYKYDDRSGRNTFSPVEVQELDFVMQPSEIEILNCVTINDVVREHAKGVWPHFLSVDIEGLDFEVIESAAWAANNAPMVVVVETRRPNTNAMRQLMGDKGFIMFVRLGENLVFVRNSLFPDLF